MELWIRSQDKKFLAKVDNIFFEDNILYYDHHENKANLGVYATEKRALEVLDEIQDQLINYENVDNLIYEMPED